LAQYIERQHAQGATYLGLQALSPSCPA
jgi:hypothetical protein